MRAFLQILAPALALAAVTTVVAPSRAVEARADPEIETMISAQIEAFGHDDAATAESFASPGIKTMFPEPDAFLGMVKKSYPALVHPRSTHFEPTSTSDAGTEQKVTVVDGNGAVWTAVYRLEKVDGHWAISGCTLLKTPETSA
jgi:hypothetical protein